MINYLELVKNDPGYFRQFSVKDLLFLNYDCPVQVKKAAKWCEHNYIYYAISGQKTLHTQDGSITLRKGSMAFVKKGACIVEQYFEEPFCVLVFIMPDSFLEQLVNEYNLTGTGIGISGNVIQLEEDLMVSNFYNSILPFFSDGMKVQEDVLELKFKELLLYILSNPQNSSMKDYLCSLNAAKNNLRQVMENNFAYNLPLESYARLTNRSVSSFKRDFKNLFQTSPGRWLSDKKIEFAKKLLLKEDSSIADVAFSSGFENITHFSKLFKQKTGLQPIQYRKKNLQQLILSN